jgi:predicted PurR-regulated permease PerM
MDRTLFVTLVSYTVAMLFLYLMFSILSPFLAVLVWGGAIGTITHSLYVRLLKRAGGRETLAATLMTTAVVLAIIVPLVGVVLTLSREAALAYHYLESVTAGSSGLAVGDLMGHPALAPLVERLRPLIAQLNLDLEPLVIPAVKNGLAVMLNYSTGMVKNVFELLFKLILLVITLFFIYRDGERFLQRFWQVVGVKEELHARITETMGRVLGAVMYGVILTCLVQGALGGIGFWVAGLPSPFLFGTLMAICAPIPFIGTALVWAPGAIYLLARGETIPGLLLIVWGVVVVSSIDNIIRPLFISGRAKLPILLIVFGVLGGFLAFGFSGVVVGPMVLAVSLVLVEVYRAATSDVQGARTDAGQAPTSPDEVIP